MADVAGNNSTHSSIVTSTTTTTTDPQPHHQRLLQPSPVPYTNDNKHDDGLVSSSGDPSSLTRPISQPAMATSRNGFGFPSHPPSLLPLPQHPPQQTNCEEDDPQQQHTLIPTRLHIPAPASAPPHPPYPPHYPSTPSNDFNDSSSSISRRLVTDENNNSSSNSSNDNPDGSASPSSTATTKPGVRKRAASIDIHEANKHPRLQDLSLYTPATGRSLATPLDVGGGPRDLICLCTKAPKVPRPRNGKLFCLFIYFRILRFRPHSLQTSSTIFLRLFLDAFPLVRPLLCSASS